MKYSILLFIINLLISITVVHAEVTLDGTLGPRIALDGPDYAIGAELGQQHGGNLFHSFEKFNIQTGESATFSGPDSINNILSRVTGGSPSSIDGTLRSTIPNADVYLINPAGLMFGPNASLDVQGSFHASTADTLRLQDGGEFNARNPQTSLLTVAPVSAFGFLSGSPQSLSMELTRLSTSSGKTLSLVGGTVQFTDTILKAASGRINIASVRNQGDVTLLPNDLALSTDAGDVTLQNTSLSVTGGGDTGGIYIRAGQFVLDNTAVQANTTTIANGGEINVQADSLIATRGSRFISQARGTGQGGRITLKIKGLTEFSGDITQKREDKTIVYPSGIIVDSTKEGNSGTIELETSSLNLKAGASINGTTYGEGQGGNINIRAMNSITLSGVGIQKQGSSIVANTRSKMENAGQGGLIVLEAKQLSMTDGARIGSVTLGVGQGGQISLKATEQVILSGEDLRGITSNISTVTAGTGDSGAVELETNQLSLLDGTKIVAVSAGTGQSGHIKIQVDDLIKLYGLSTTGGGSYITANAQGKTADAGNGGTIELSAKRLHLSDGAQITSNSSGPGQGGQININIYDEVILSGNAVLMDEDGNKNTFRSGIFTTAKSTADNAGNAGSIVLITDELQLSDGAGINAKTVGPGQGGDINIQAQTLQLTNGGTITARSEAQGNAGQIKLTLGDKLLMRNGAIETKAESADGGNLAISATNYVYLINSTITTSVSEEFGGGGNVTAHPQFVVLDDSQIFAKAKKGKGGNIDITTNGIYNFTGEPIAEVINASSEFGVDGVVTIATPDTNAEEGFLVLPNNFFDASALLDNHCQKMIDNFSSFTVVKSQGVPNAPDDLLPSGMLLFTNYENIKIPSIARKSQNMNLSTKSKPSLDKLAILCKN